MPEVGVDRDDIVIEVAEVGKKPVGSRHLVLDASDLASVGDGGVDFVAIAAVAVAAGGRQVGRSPEVVRPALAGVGHAALEDGRVDGGAVVGEDVAVGHVRIDGFAAGFSERRQRREEQRSESEKGKRAVAHLESPLSEVVAVESARILNTSMNYI
ncbi:MAG: hypothetical protein JWN64_682 [Parcubacteria group bacterium]|nr:hypothetical protein [Parcubacteria group bacterium]